MQSSRRDRKREQTRQHILAEARRLFLAQGFERTTVLQIAEAADVAVQTVFNHAPSKEALFFLGRIPYLEAMTRPVDPTGDRTAAEVLVAQLAEQTLGYLRSLEDPDNLAMAAQVDSSPALAQYERTLLAHSEGDLAAVLEEQVPGVDGWLAAALLVAITRTHAYVQRRRIIGGTPPAEVLASLERDLPRHLNAVLEVATRAEPDLADLPDTMRVIAET
ncbi:transcriptional regulator, TetR family [Klenkia marina]|uniref:Transcriptional regulator, TetR family n=1 Tax=Klenkia marina TaxID=1960309 RepID=A0A1G4YYM9_9ACTN|nr:TetR/AcrR family transcriptional regulator [Klenkia marina]SCX58511.1 transcriptional regulator, TetR family [Klenkia marina]